MQNFTSTKWYAWLSWFLPALCFLVMYIARVSPAPMVSEMMQSFHASHKEIGLLGSAFIQSYVFMQLPVGILVDRFGAVTLLIIASILGSFGNYLFAISDNLTMAYLARFIMGIGSASIFICSLKQAKVWLDIKYFALACGITQVFGMLGGAIGNNLLTYFHFDSWRNGILFVSLIWSLLIIVMLVFLRNKKDDTQENLDLYSVLYGLKNVFKSKDSWLNGFYAGLIFLPIEVLGEWWGSYYLSISNNVTTSVSGSWIAFVFIGWGIGGSLIGYVASYYNCYRVMMMLSSFMSFILLSIIIYFGPYFTSYMPFLFFTFGFFSTGLVLAYALSATFHEEKYAGSAIAFTNIMSIILGAAFQPVVGYSVAALTPVFGEKIAFDYIMGVLPILLLVSSVFAFFIKLPKKYK